MLKKIQELAMLSLLATNVASVAVYASEGSSEDWLPKDKVVVAKAKLALTRDSTA